MPDSELDKMLDDANKFGTGYGKTKQDGSIEHIEIDKVIDTTNQTGEESMSEELKPAQQIADEMLEHLVGLDFRTSIDVDKARKMIRQAINRERTRPTPNTDQVVEAATKAKEYINHIPLHSDDFHVLHYCEQATNWLDEALKKEGVE